MAGVTIQVQGFTELARRMKDLDLKVKRKFIRAATAAAANVVVKAGRENAQVKTGDLKAAISSRRSRKYSNSAKGYEQRDVGVFKVKGGKYANNRRNRNLGRVGKTFEQDPPSFYWRFQEFGTAKMPAHPFLRPAFDQNRNAAIGKMADSLRKNIIKAGK